MNHVVGIILARGGSKGVPKKNIRSLAGVPLLAYSILEAKRSSKISKLVVSSDDDEILSIAKQLNCETIIRPDEFATDEASSPSALIHAINQIEKREIFEVDAVVLLQPTTPFRKFSTIDECIDLYKNQSADSVVSVMPAPHFVNPHWVRKIEDGYLKPYMNQNDYTRRQDLPKVYWRNGQVYVTKKEVLFKTNDLYGQKSLPFIMNDDYPVNIDNLIDFKFAEFLISQKNIDFDVDFIKSEFSRYLK
jgi:CMP-N,N'-diacetyllegionaminic acid synthase